MPGRRPHGDDPLGVLQRLSPLDEHIRRVQHRARSGRRLPEVLPPSGVRRPLANRFAAALAVASPLAATFARSAHAAPQASAALTVGGGAVTDDGRTIGAFHIGARGDVLLFRRSDRDMGVGPFRRRGERSIPQSLARGRRRLARPRPRGFPLRLRGGSIRAVRRRRCSEGGSSARSSGARGGSISTAPTVCRFSSSSRAATAREIAPRRT